MPENGSSSSRKLRIDHQRPRNLHAPPFAARKHVAAAAAHLIEAELIDQPLHLFAPLAVAQRQRFENRHQILFHRELAEDRSFLRKIADAAAGALVHRQMRDVLDRPAERCRNRA